MNEPRSITRRKNRVTAARPQDFARFRGAAGEGAAYCRQLDEQYRQAVPEVAGALKREIGIMRRRASDELRRFGAGPDNTRSIRIIAAGYAQESSFLDLAVTAAYGAGVTSDSDGSFRDQMDWAVRAAFQAGGAPDAEKICRAVTFSGLVVVPKNMRGYVRSAFSQLIADGQTEEAFKVALYWSTSCLMAVEGPGSITGLTPPISEAEAVAAFAAWKGIERRSI